MARDVPITGTMIRLGQLLKLAAIIDSGSEVKSLLATGEVFVNQKIETRRGRQLHSGDVVRVGDDELRITVAS